MTITIILLVSYTNIVYNPIWLSYTNMMLNLLCLIILSIEADLPSSIHKHIWRKSTVIHVEIISQEGPVPSGDIGTGGELLTGGYHRYNRTLEEKWGSAEYTWYFRIEIFRIIGVFFVEVYWCLNKNIWFVECNNSMPPCFLRFFISSWSSLKENNLTRRPESVQLTIEVNSELTGFSDVRHRWRGEDTSGFFWF